MPDSKTNLLPCKATRLRRVVKCCFSLRLSLRISLKISLKISLTLSGNLTELKRIINFLLWSVNQTLASLFLPSIVLSGIQNRCSSFAFRRPETFSFGDFTWIPFETSQLAKRRSFFLLQRSLSSGHGRPSNSQEIRVLTDANHILNHIMSGSNKAGSLKCL